MKLLLLGDLHGDIGIAKGIVDSVEVDYVLQTGDMTVYSAFSKPAYFIAGNHENFEIIRALDKSLVKFNNLRHIKTAEVISLKKGDEELKISGINGNYSPAYKERERHFTIKDVEKCKKLRGIDIFLSHEAPAGVIHPRWKRDVGVKSIEEIMNAIKPRYFIFGHHHFFFEKEFDGIRIYGLNYARNEYCILDTNENLLKRMKT